MLYVIFYESYETVLLKTNFQQEKIQPVLFLKGLLTECF